MSLCLDRKEVRHTPWRVHNTGQVETQDVFFWRLAGWSAPTGLAIVLIFWLWAVWNVKTTCTKSWVVDLYVKSNLIFIPTRGSLAKKKDNVFA